MNSTPNDPAPATTRLIILLLLAVQCLGVSADRLVGAEATPNAAAIDAPAKRDARARLVLFVTVDQLRGDVPMRLAARFGKDGFARLMHRGIHFTNAHYRHSTTFTAVGHATLFTGGNGYSHGMAGNDWYDAATGRDVYCVQDDRYTAIGLPAGASRGTSPANLTSSTIGDELIEATGGRSRVFSVSIKDRGAILPAGHQGQAYWYDSKTGQFITSTYYRDRYPQWVERWNEKGHADRYRDKVWKLLHPRDQYLHGDNDDRAVERPYKNLGRNFPHALHHDADKDFYAALRYTPMGDELTVAFAAELLRREKLGAGEVTDMLAVSLSATDYIGHAWGPESLEAEDNMLRVDRHLAALFKAVDQAVGLDQTLIILSSDHGIDMTPEARHNSTCLPKKLDKSFRPRSPQDLLLQRMAKSGAVELCCNAGRHFPERFKKSLNAALRNRFKIDRDLVIRFWNPSLYLDTKAIDELGLDIAVVERELAERSRRLPGFSRAATRTDLLAGRVPNDPIMKKVQRAFHATRSGNVMLVQSQFWYLYPDATGSAAMHGSPYAYDTYVPIMIAGPGIRPRRVDRAVGPEDIAPTVARYLKIKPPSGSGGNVLLEVFHSRH